MAHLDLAGALGCSEEFTEGISHRVAEGEIWFPSLGGGGRFLPSGKWDPPPRTGEMLYAPRTPWSSYSPSLPLVLCPRETDAAAAAAGGYPALATMGGWGDMTPARSAALRGDREVLAWPSADWGSAQWLRRAAELFGGEGFHHFRSVPFCGVAALGDRRLRLGGGDMWRYLGALVDERGRAWRIPDSRRREAFAAVVARGSFPPFAEGE